jgi:Nitroreductase
MKQFKLLFLAMLLCTSVATWAQSRQPIPVNETPKNDAVMKAILTRKSVRTYTPQNVTKEDIMPLLQAGMSAPSAMNRQPWEFIVITDRTQMKKLIEANHNNEQILQGAKAAIIVCGNMKKTIEGEGKDYWIQDCSAATENILIAAESMGLGAVWTGVYPIKTRVNALKKALALPEYIIPLNVIPLGWQTGNDNPKDKFTEKAIHWDKF